MACEVDNRIYRRIKEKAAKKLIPLDVLFELTYRCNLSCCHCYVIHRKRPELSTDRIKEILDQLAAAGTLFLTLTGGEILTREDFFDIATYAREKGFSLRLFTNSTLIDARVADRVRELYPIAVEISLYGATRATHETITNVPGSYDKTIAAFQLLKERNIRTIMKTVWMKQNFSEFLLMVELAKELGTTPKFSLVISPKNNGSLIPLAYRLSNEELSSFFSLMYQNQEEELASQIDELSDRTVGVTQAKSQAITCAAGVTHCAISPYGEVFPCIDIPEVAGDLNEMSFQEIWTSSARLYRLRKKRSTIIPECQNCNLLAQCFRCPGLALREDGSLFSPSSEACRLAKARKEVLRRYGVQKRIPQETVV